MQRAGKAKPMKTHCINGHAYTPENTGHMPNGTYYCRICSRAHWRANHPQR